MFRSAGLLLMLLISFPAVGQLNWQSDIGAAQSQAKKTSRSILLFFSGKGSVADHYESLFKDPDVQKSMQQYILIRLDINEHRELATQMGVFRPGVMFVFGPDASGKLKIDESMKKEQFVSALSPTGKSAEPATARATQTPPALGNFGPPPPEIPKGKLVGGPVTPNMKSGADINVGKTEKDKKYVLVLEGTHSPWGGTIPRADALYTFVPRSGSGQKNLSTFLRFKDKKRAVYDFYKDQKGEYPAYRQDHKYEIPLTGDGKNVVLYFHEATPRNYEDNIGSLKFSLYEAQ